MQSGREAPIRFEIPVYQTIRRQFPEDLDVNIHRHENLNSNNGVIYVWSFKVFGLYLDGVIYCFV
jgi:hypothetical protein